MYWNFSILIQLHTERFQATLAKPILYSVWREMLPPPMTQMAAGPLLVVKEEDRLSTWDLMAVITVGHTSTRSCTPWVCIT